MQPVIRIGTRESQLAVWQANTVKEMLEANGYEAILHFVKSEGDIDLKTPLYEMGVQGIFTHSLDIALINNRIDVAVHSMKDVPTKLSSGLVQAAVLERGNHKDLLVWNQAKDRNRPDDLLLNLSQTNVEKPGNYKPFIATSSIRRKAQWLNRYPESSIGNIRGNVNTRLQKLSASNWDGALFAAAGLERIGLKPANAIELDWMLPAPAQGAVMVACREDDAAMLAACNRIDHAVTAMCTKVEKDFLRVLLGGCSTPISAYARAYNNELYFEGSILSVDGKMKAAISRHAALPHVPGLGQRLAEELLINGGKEIAETIQRAS